MIEHVWTVVCSRAVVDRESNIISLHDIIEQLNIEGEPVPDGMIPLRLEVATLWTRSNFDVPERGRARLVFLSPTRMIGNPPEVEVDLSNVKRHRTMWRFQGLPASESGRHIFRVEFQDEGETEWRQVAAVPLEIIFTPPDLPSSKSE
jgi:hypothetical protein